MRLLDLFCGAGGSAMGYWRAGFDVVGVDINPQPRYPFTFIQGDALDPPVNLESFDLIHASPPCQAHSTLRHSPGATDYPDLIDATRSLIAGFPYVIENVVGAPLDNPIRLCGSMFDLRSDGFELRRHRLFETSFPILAPPCTHRQPVLGVYGDLAKNRRRSNRGVKAGREDAHHLMGIDWMTDSELTEAIPPAYTSFIGEQFIAQRAAA
jgi:DNA (cytosine-5)-methyltransferase 1